MKELAEKCFAGEVTLPKVTLWLIGAVCLMGGIVCGLNAAPMTHGVWIGSNNGNHNGNNNGNNNGNGNDQGQEGEEEEAAAQ